MCVSGCENTPAGHQALFFPMHELSEVHGIGKFEMHHLVYEYKKSVRQDMSQHNVKSLIWRITSFALTILSKSNSKTCNTYTENVSTWNACLYNIHGTYQQYGKTLHRKREVCGLEPSRVKTDASRPSDVALVNYHSIHLPELEQRTFIK